MRPGFFVVADILNPALERAIAQWIAEHDQKGGPQ
jgi:hypothetical protein